MSTQAHPERKEDPPKEGNPFHKRVAKLIFDIIKSLLGR